MTKTYVYPEIEIPIDFNESMAVCPTCKEDMWVRDEQGKATALANMCKCERDQLASEPYSTDVDADWEENQWDEHANADLRIQHFAKE